MAEDARPGPESDEAWLDDAIGVYFEPEGTREDAPRSPAGRRFHLGEEIARDATSVVLRGRDLELNREVSLRVLESGADVSRFLEQVQISAQIQHPSILPVYATGLLDDGRAYLAQPLAEGNSLADLQGRKTGSHRLLAVLEQAAQGLAFAHARGVAHGHVTADRIVVGSHREVVVTGWERAVRANGDPAPLREDVRALGTLLAELDGRLDDELAGLVRRCVADDPTGRPRHAGEVARAMSAHLGRAEARARRAELRAAEERARAEEARSREVIEHSRSLRSRAARRWTLALAAVAVLAVILGGIGHLWRRAEDQAAAGRASVEVSGAIREATRCETAGDLAGAAAWSRKAVALARSTGGEPGLPDRAREVQDRLEREIRRRQTDHALLARLESLRLRRHGRPTSLRVRIGEGDRLDELVLRDLAPQYAAAFREAGTDVARQETTQAAEAIRARSDPVELAAALEEWAALPGTEEVSGRLIEIARLADPDPWRDEVRRARLRRDPNALRALVAAGDVVRLPVRSLVLLAWSLRFVGDAEGALAVLREAQRRDPRDPSLNATLARMLEAENDASLANRISRSRFLVVVQQPDSGCRWTDLARALGRQGDAEGALAAARRSLALDSSHAHHWFTLGAALALAGDRESVPEGLAALRTAVELDPHLELAQYRLGKWLLVLGRHTEAIPELLRAAELMPAVAEVRCDLGGALGGAERFEEALVVLEKAVTLDPDLGEAHYNRGLVLQTLDRLDEAIVAYGRAAELLPESCDVHFNLAVALRGVGRVDEAMAAHREAVRLDPQDPDSHYELGVTLTDHVGDHAGALVAFREAIRLDPDRPIFHDARGLAHLRRGELQKAEAACRNAVRLDPSSGGGYRRLGTTLVQQGRLEEAEPVLRKALEFLPRDVESFVNLSLVLLRTDRPEDAATVLRQAIGFAEGVWQLHANLAVAQKRLGRYEEAIGSYRRTIALAPPHAGMLNSLAWLLATCPEARHRRPDEAVRLAQRALALAPGNGDFVRTLGAALYRANRFDEAIRALGHSLRLRPEADARTWLFIAMAHARLGQEHEAREWYEKVVAWMSENETDDDLRRFRIEAEEVITR